MERVAFIVRLQDLEKIALHYSIRGKLFVGILI